MLRKSQAQVKQKSLIFFTNLLTVAILWTSTLRLSVIMENIFIVPAAQ